MKIYRENGGYVAFEIFGALVTNQKYRRFVFCFGVVPRSTWEVKSEKKGRVVKRN
jgi:hypothetical protein